MIYLLIFSIIAIFATQQWLTKGYLYRRAIGGKWQKIWYDRANNGGYEVWERARPDFDWESVGGRVTQEEL